MKRSELYDRIWSTPASKLAEELGISGSRIAAICRRHNIPTPPRGYWAKLGVGKHVPQTPLPQPEADYEVKVQTPQRPANSSAWLARGVLLRPTAIEEPRETEDAPPRPQPPSQPAAAWAPPPAVRKAPTPNHSPPRAHSADADLELVRAAAAQLQDIQAIQDLMQAVVARAVHARPEEAQRILQWAAGVRDLLGERDPVEALLRLATSAR